ncbi:MAG TPA: hypothetical protein PKB15_06565, partial [Acidimicrobiia bacterium]|nr:hypothetical protein [Acidimicrobiia bacterium]
RGPNGELNYGMIGGIAVAIVLVILLIFVVMKPFSSAPKAAAPIFKPKDPTKSVDFLDAYAADSAMATSLQASLEAWAKYYTTADLVDLQQTFDLAGEQYAELASQQAEIAAAPEAGEPSVIELGPLGKVERIDNIFTVRVVVSWTKPGAPTGSTFKWDIDMKSRSDGNFILKTIRETNPTEKQPVDFCGAVDVVSGLDKAEVVNDELTKTPPEQQIALVGQVFDIKVKAWEILNVTVAGSDSEPAVAGIVDHYKAIAEASKTDDSLEKILNAGPDQDLETFREIIESRADLECDADIKDR